MFVKRLAFVLVFMTAFSNFKRISSKEVESTSIEKDDVPSSVDSRFFDLGGFINQLFSGFNQENQSRPDRNPGGIDLPGNSQFDPGSFIQNTPSPQFPNNQANQWPIIDDAKNYQNQGHSQNVRPGISDNYPNFGGPPQSQYTYPDYDNNFGQFPSGGGFSQQYPQVNQQYPNQGGFPQNVNKPDFGGIQSSPYPNWGAGYQPIPYPNQGSNGFTPKPYPNEGIYESSPSMPYPEDSNYGGTTPSPYPGNSGGSPSVDYPNQGGFNNPNNFRPGPIDEESIRRPPESQIPWDPEAQDPNETISKETTTTPRPPAPVEEEGSQENGRNAILGKPVIVSETTTPEGQIFFPDSTEDAAQKQCVQDCQSPTEYNPVCGTNNVTYINPGKFVCARNCGIHVFVKQNGRCFS